jgi:methyl-accepting chemotaxis protein
MPLSNTETLLVIFIAITSLAVLLQAGVLLGMFLTMRKALQVGKQEADEYRAKLSPLIAQVTPMLADSQKLIGTAGELVTAAKDMIQALDPKLQAAAAELAQMASSVHQQADRLQVSAEEIAQGVRRQAARVDNMTTNVLNGVDRAGRFISEAVNVPVRQVSGVVAAAKAVVDTLRAPSPPHASRTMSGVRADDEKDLFV